MDENTLQSIDWFNQSMFQSPYLYSSPVISSGNKKTDWLGMAVATAPQLYQAAKGVKEGVKAFNTFKSASPSVFSKAVPDAFGAVTNRGSTVIGAQASKLGAAGAGALKALGGIGGITGLASTALSFTGVGREADIKNTGDKALKYASIAAPLLLGASNPIGWGLTAAHAINQLTGKTADKQDITQATNVGSGYTGDYVADLAGKKISGLGRLFNKKSRRPEGINQNVKNYQSILARASDVGYRNKQNILGSMTSTQDILNKNRQQLLGGQTTNILAAKSGVKLLDLKNIKAKANHNLLKLQKGGVVEVISKEPVNVIPSGVLHARKHNLPEEIAKHVTNKGIPVVTFEEGGEVKQHAEIEVNEIIFHKKLTNQIEQLLKKFERGDEDAAIEAGKILVYEILENTQDNTGLLEQVE